MKKYDVAVVAAAILIQEGDLLHYRTITRCVLASGLTTLGEKGDSPAQTVGAILRKAHKGVDLFARLGPGDYTIANEDDARKFPQVEEVLNLLATKR